MESTIHDVLRAKGTRVHMIDSFSPVFEAVRLMRRHGIGSVVVESDGQMVGVVSERDLLLSVMDDRGRDPRSLRIYEVMDSRLITVSPDDTVGRAMQLMTEMRRRHLPVMDGRGLCGLVSIGDLTRWVTRDLTDQVSQLVAYMHGPTTSPMR